MNGRVKRRQTRPKAEFHLVSSQSLTTVADGFRVRVKVRVHGVTRNISANFIHGSCFRVSVFVVAWGMGYPECFLRFVIGENLSCHVHLGQKCYYFRQVKFSGRCVWNKLPENLSVVKFLKMSYFISG